MRSGKSDILAALFIFVVALAFHLQSGELKGISLYFPRILLVFLTWGGVILMGLGIYKVVKKIRFEAGEPVAIPRVIIISIGSIAYVAIIPLLGFFPASAVFLFIMAMILRDTSVDTRKIALLAAVFATVLCLAVWIGFTVLLNVPTPPSIFFES